MDLLVRDYCSYKTEKGWWEWDDVYDVMKTDPAMGQIGVVLLLPKRRP